MQLGDVSLSSLADPRQTECTGESHESIVFAKGSAEACGLPLRLLVLFLFHVLCHYLRCCVFVKMN